MLYILENDYISNYNMEISRLENVNLLESKFFGLLHFHRL